MGAKQRQRFFDLVKKEIEGSDASANPTRFALKLRKADSLFSEIHTLRDSEVIGEYN